MQSHPRGGGVISAITPYLHQGDRTFAIIPLGCADLFIETEADADELIKATCLAKDMLHQARHAATMTAPPAAGRRTGVAMAPELEVNEAGHPTGNYRSPYTAGSAAEVAQGLPVLDGEGGEYAPRWSTPGLIPDYRQRPGEDRAAWTGRLLDAGLITVAEAEQMAGSTP